ncbi:MAG: hypothetical protein AB2L20_11915 [Mangrovibacterium sp.]
MNARLFELIKAKAKDTGLSEKYLKAITEKLGGSVADDSTDETAIEAEANRLVDIFVETQGEATRWASKKDKTPEPSKSKKDKDGDDEEKEPAWFSKYKEEHDKKLTALEQENQNFKQKQTAAERTATIKGLASKHKIPDFLMKRVIIPDDVDADKFLTEYKQDLITNNLMPKDLEGGKASLEKASDEAADEMLKQFEAK